MADAPAGFVRVTAGGCVAVVLAAHEEDARRMLHEGSLYEAAARDLAARTLQGRGVAYAVALPATGTRAVARSAKAVKARMSRKSTLTSASSPSSTAPSASTRSARSGST